MSRTIHNLYLFMLTLIVFVVFVYLLINGYSYYTTPMVERFDHGVHDALKPNGLIGHGLGIIGSLLLIIGVFGYMARKRIHRLSRIGYLKYWLEFHIFLCSLGPVLILYHTAFKFGGIVAISFWSMVAVVASGIIGRFIYIQIPRTIEGREMSLNEVKNLRAGIGEKLEDLHLGQEAISSIDKTISSDERDSNGNIFRAVFEKLKEERKSVRKVKKQLKDYGLQRKEFKKVIVLVKKEAAINRRINLLVIMQDLLRYWHVAHLPFALIMLVIMIVHVVIAVLFGYKWIF